MYEDVLKKIIPYGKQHITENDIRIVTRTLRSDWITQGPLVEDFEKRLAKFCGAKYAVAVSSGTAALHITVLAGGLKKGDEAITSPITFLATSNSIVYAGAKPVFADIEYGPVNIDPQEIKKKINKKTKAILPVHFAGLPCKMPEIYKIAKKKGLLIIEDACHSLGAEYKFNGKWIKAGSCRHSDMTVFSFHPVKHITTGEGGAVTTNSKKLYEKLKALRSHGIYKTPGMKKEQGPWYYEMRDLGFNYRITDFQCALGLGQLDKLRDFLRKRRRIARMYDKAFKGVPGLETPPVEIDKKNAYHLYPLKIDFRSAGISRKTFFDKLAKDGIFPQVHYRPIFDQPYYKKKYKANRKNFKNSNKYYERALSISIYPGMTDKDV
ncbi:MAG: UDP-4-amino-4,6-dideoxy-N-acetyl-beta-L-altrosamine transaminase, partial [Candidatus Omnitrophica bacterium]|nr:UDP-4-amino-4,6-dideoxy-N-acetyl-beta-L-altrosamine transaminase [Candidatus Omnitrophota bacterium]